MRLTLLRYFFKRWGLPLLGAVLFFGGLMMANDLVRISRSIFSQGASIRWLIPILLTSLPETFAMVLPMAAILGGLIGTQHLAEGSEMVASQGLGVGMRSILKPWSILSAMLLVAALINANVIVPRVSSNMEKIEKDMVEEAKTRFLKPGAPPFIPPKNPQTGIWMAPDGEVHIFEVTASEVQHLVARNLEWRRETDGNNRTYALLNLTDLTGCRYQKANQSVGLFAEQSHNFRFDDLPSQPSIFVSTPVRYRSTKNLIDTALENRPPFNSPARIYQKLLFQDTWIELARRITLPLSVVALLLFGIALGLEHPRFRRGGALLKSLAVIVSYYLVMKFIENWFTVGIRTPSLLFLPPFLFFLTAFGLLFWKIRPHRSNRIRFLTAIDNWNNRLVSSAVSLLTEKWDALSAVSMVRISERGKRKGVLGRWTRSLWWKNWGAALGTLLTLDLLMEYVPIASDLSKNGISFGVFLRYWVWNLPTFLAIAFPVSFLMGGVMAFSDAAISREWTALKAGGASLLQWIGSGAQAWIAVIVLTFGIQAIVAPVMVGRAAEAYSQIKNEPIQSYKTKPWMHLTSTDIIWFLERDYRWGFSLKSPGDGPILYRWKRGETRVDELPWNELDFKPGVNAETLFPSKALRSSANAEETSTVDLFQWQKWAPDPERATMLWGRLLDWLAGPCLMFAMLAYAFPLPRMGRGQVLGVGLVVGLLFLGMQALFGGAARAGEIPALWGVIAPLTFLLGFGFFNLNRLRT